MGESIVVIGGTAAGMSAASKAKRSRPDFEVTVYERTGWISYGSCGLPYFIGDTIEKAEDLISLTTAQARNDKGINAFTQHEVIAIDRTAKTVEVHDLEKKQNFIKAYDNLVIATGATPFVPDIPNIDSPGVFFLRNVEDGIALKNKAHSGVHNVLIIGAGFIGLECAEALTEAGLKVTLLESAPRLLPFMPERYSDTVLSVLRNHGVQVELGSMATEVLRKNDVASGIKTSENKVFEADFILVSVGAVPNTKLAEKAGLRLGIKNSILVNEQMKTSDPNIWACGDCVQMTNLITGSPCYVPLGTTANKQGRITGGNIVGEMSSFKGVLGSQVTRIFDIYAASTGLTLEQARQAGFEAASESIIKSDKASYYPGGIEAHLTLVFEINSGRILGAQGIGGISIVGRLNVLVSAITSGMTIDTLNELDFLYSPPVAPVYDPLLIAASQALKKVKK